MEEEVSVLCRIEAMELMDMASKHPIIHLRICTHLIVGRFMVLSLEQAVVASRGVEVVAGYSVVGGGSVVGSRKEWLHGGHEGTYRPLPSWGRKT